MDRAEVRKYQFSQLWLLEQFDSITKDLGLKYYLVFGSLIGVVRHKGFIPWDPDIDVAMHRADYEKLRDFFASQPIDYLFFDSYKTEEFHVYPHDILRIKGTHVYLKEIHSCKYKPTHDGIYIDIFPIDSLAENEMKIRKQVKDFCLIMKLIMLKSAFIYGKETSKIKILGKKAVSNLLKCISFKKLHYYLEHIMQRYNSTTDSSNVVILTDAAIEKATYPRTCLANPLFMEFEGKKYPCPTNPEEFLKIEYSDFMTLPPETERWKYLDNVIESVDYGSCPSLLKFITERIAKEESRKKDFEKKDL